MSNFRISPFLLLSAILCGALYSGAILANKDQWGGSQIESTDVWTQADWEQWVQDIESAYLAGMSEKELYWWVRDQIDAIEAVEPNLDVNFPPPYSGWTDDPPGGGSLDPYATPGSSFGVQSFPCNPSAPGGCSAPVVQHPGIVDLTSPTTIQEFRTLGATLAAAGVATGNKATAVAGAALVAVAEGLELWVLEEDEEGENDNE